MTTTAAPGDAPAVVDVFPSLDAERIERRVERAWEIVDGRFPLPRWRVQCPAAGSTPDPRDPHRGGHDVQLSRMHFARRKSPATVPGRADVVFKCCACSLCWTHGIPVPVEIYERAVDGHGNTWRWREILEAIGGREELNLRTR